MFAIAGLPMFIPVLGITIGSSTSGPSWQLVLVGIIGEGVWSVLSVIYDSSIIKLLIPDITISKSRDIPVLRREMPLIRAVMQVISLMGSSS